MCFYIAAHGHKCVSHEGLLNKEDPFLRLQQWRGRRRHFERLLWPFSFRCTEATFARAEPQRGRLVRGRLLCLCKRDLRIQRRRLLFGRRNVIVSVAKEGVTKKEVRTHTPTHRHTQTQVQGLVMVQATRSGVVSPELVGSSLWVTVIS